MKKGISMIAGMPGTGIGGLLYLIIAIQMHIEEFYFTLIRKNSLKRLPVVKHHLFITAGIIIGMFATGWFIALTIPVVISQNLSVPINFNIKNNVIQINPFIFSLATLIGVYIGVHVLRIIVRQRKAE